MDILLDPSFLNPFAAVNIAFIFTITGGALGMYLISMPLIQSAHPFPSAVLLNQFHQLIIFGARYMQTSARIQSAMLAALALLSYLSEAEECHARWLWFAGALGTLLQTAWYEIVFVFPTNDRLVEMKKILEGVSNNAKADTEMKPEALRLLETWNNRHIPRILLPFAAGVLLIKGILL